MTITKSVSSISLLPREFNLEWVQGDTASFQFLFTGVLWLSEDPGDLPEGAPEVVPTAWSAQVRTPYMQSTYAADAWVPANGIQYKWWRSKSVVGEFDVTGIPYEMPDTDPTQWATLVTLTLPADKSALILPASWYRWDLQSRSDADEVKTHLRGKAKIVTEWTVR